MTRLSPNDFDRLQDTVLELYEYRQIEDFAKAVPTLFLKIIPADFFSMMDGALNPKTQSLTVVRYWESEPLINRAILDAVEQNAEAHPFTQYSLPSQDPAALKISDFLNLHQFRDSKLYQELYRLLHAERFMAVACPVSTGMSTLNISRSLPARDFTERDRLMMNLLRPHFSQARRNAELATARSKSQVPPLHTFGLTLRETEIAMWIAKGKTNPEIGIILQANVRTVEKHAEKIYEKLGVENRTAAALMITQAETMRP